MVDPFFDIPWPTVPDFATVKLPGEAAADLPAGSVFCPVDLGDWIELCGRAGVPFIPAERIASISVRDVVQFDTPEAPATLLPFFAAVRDRMAALGPNWMVRWSCCACMEVKYQLGKGRPDWTPEFAELRIDDLRAFDHVYDFPRPEVSAWARPWAALAVIDSYPVEYRVYVESNAIIGVSSYYPQRPLPNDAATAADINLVRVLSEKLIAAQQKPLLCPELRWAAPDLSLDINHWSADFARLATGEVAFLEGGPPYTGRWGGHPCCFYGRKPDGIALEATPEALEEMGIAPRPAAEMPA